MSIVIKTRDLSPTRLPMIEQTTMEKFMEIKFDVPIILTEKIINVILYSAMY